MRDEVGSPPLAAPIGQIIGSQALINVLTANRYSTMVDELRDLVEGRFGRTPGADRPGASARGRAAHGGRHAERRAVDSSRSAKRPRAWPRARRSCCSSRSSAKRRSRCCARSAARSGGEETLAASGVDRARAEKIRELVRIVQETGIGEITIEEDGMRVSVRRESEQGSHRSPRRRRPHRSNGELCAPRPRDDAFVRVESPMVGTFYRAPAAGRAAVRRGGRRGRAGPDALHPRGDEADERGQGRGRGRSCVRSTSGTPSRSSTASCCSSSSRSRPPPLQRSRCSRGSWSRTGARSPSA